VNKFTILRVGSELEKGCAIFAIIWTNGIEKCAYSFISAIHSDTGLGTFDQNHLLTYAFVMTRLLSFFILTLHATIALAAPQPKILLEFPRGRYEESDPPTFFKWSKPNGVKSLSVKVARANDDGTYDLEAGLLAKFDLFSDTQSISWPFDTFAPGKYVWFVEGYDDKSPNPIFVEKASFYVAELQSLEVTSSRMGAIMGFSRGEYRSFDRAYRLKFDTTPTTYGAFVRGSHNQNFWDLTASMNDFVLRGTVRKATDVRGLYAWKILEKKPYQLEYFVGPSLRFSLGPLVRSSDGTNLTVKEYSVFNPGVSFTLQRRLNLQLTLLSQITVDLPVFGGSKVKTDFDQLNYDLRAGFIYGLFWPIGFGADVSYKVNKATPYDSSTPVEIDNTEWAMIGNLIYLF